MAKKQAKKLLDAAYNLLQIKLPAPHRTLHCLGGWLPLRLAGNIIQSYQAALSCCPGFFGLCRRHQRTPTADHARHVLLCNALASQTTYQRAVLRCCGVDDRTPEVSAAEGCDDSTASRESWRKVYCTSLHSKRSSRKTRSRTPPSTSLPSWLSPRPKSRTPSSSPIRCPEPASTT